MKKNIAKTEKGQIMNNATIKILLDNLERNTIKTRTALLKVLEDNARQMMAIRTMKDEFERKAGK